MYEISREDESFDTNTKELRHIDKMASSHYQACISVRNKSVVNVHDDGQDAKGRTTPSGRQSEQQNKSYCGAGWRYRHARASVPSPPPRSLAAGVVGVHSFFLLILLFPQTGSQALIQRHWLPHGNPPPVLCERPKERDRERGEERMKGWDHPSAPCSSSIVPGKERRFSSLLRVFFDSPQPSQPSFPRLHSLTRLPGYSFMTRLECIIFTLRLRFLKSR